MGSQRRHERIVHGAGHGQHANRYRSTCGSVLPCDSAHRSKRTCIIDCHVEGVCGEVTMHGVRVGLTTDASTCSICGCIIVSQEVRERCGGGRGMHRGVKCTGDDMPVGELEVIEGVDIKVSYSDGRAHTVGGVIG